MGRQSRLWWCLQRCEAGMRKHLHWWALIVYHVVLLLPCTLLITNLGWKAHLFVFSWPRKCIVAHGECDFKFPWHFFWKWRCENDQICNNFPGLSTGSQTKDRIAWGQPEKDDWMIENLFPVQVWDYSMSDHPSMEVLSFDCAVCS